VNTVTASLDTVMGKMTEMSQRNKNPETNNSTAKQTEATFTNLEKAVFSYSGKTKYLRLNWRELQIPNVH